MGGIKHLLRAGQEVNCPFPAGSGLPTALSLRSRWETEGVDSSSSSSLCARGRGSPASQVLRQGWESNPKAPVVQVPPGPLVGWRVEENFSRATYTEKLMFAEQETPVACESKRTGSSVLPTGDALKAPSCSMATARCPPGLSPAPCAFEERPGGWVARHNLQTPILHRTSQGVRQP